MSERRTPWLRGLNPLAKSLALAPAMLSLFFVRDPAIPLAFAVLGIAAVLTGAGLSPRSSALVLAGPPLAALVLSVSFGVWTDPARVGDGPVLLGVAGHHFTAPMWLAGLGTALRIVAMTCLSLVAALTTTGAELSRSLVQQLRVPYRVGVAALAAFTFLPRLRDEMRSVEAAHRVRGGVGPGGPLGAPGRWMRLAVPMLAGAIRHAERVALTMDARAFGLHRTRTELHPVPLRVRDWGFVATAWAATALIIVAPALVRGAA